MAGGKHTTLGGREAALVVALSLVGAALVLWQPLLGGRSTLSFDARHPLYPAPWADPVADERPSINPITSDIDFFVLPGLMRLRQLEDGGHPVWWDPNQLLGYPLGANLPFPFFLPVTWITDGVDPVTALDLLLWIHTALAAALAYRAVRRLGGSPTAGAIGAVGFALSAWMFTRWHLPQIAWTTAWWPGFVAVTAGLRAGRWAAATAELALWTFLGLVSGFPQAGVAFIGGFGLLLLLDGQLRRPKPFAVAAVGVALGVMLAAPQLNALGSVYDDSARATPTTRQATAEQGLAPGALWGAVVPELFGRPSDFATADPPAPSMEEYLPRRELLTADVQDNPVENALYPGIVTLLLLSLLATRAVDRRARHLALVALVALLGAIVFPALVRAAPGLAALGSAHIKRLLVLVAGCLPLAAALAVDSLKARSARPVVVAGLALAAVLVACQLWASSLDAADATAFSQRLQPELLRQGVFLFVGTAMAVLFARGMGSAGAGLVAVAVIDLVGLAWAFNPFPPQRVPFPATESTAWLSRREGRVAVLGSQLLLPPTVATLHGIRSVHGTAPLLSRRTAELLACVEGPLIDVRDPRVVRPFVDPRSLDHPLLDLLQVDTVVHADPELAASRGVANAYENPAESLAALDRPTVGPRAFVCGGAEVVADAEARLSRLADRAFDPFATVLLEDTHDLDLPRRGEMVPAVVDRADPGRIELDVRSPMDGVLVVSEAWHAGWQALVNGEPTTLLRVHHALMGLTLPAGDHRVELVYELPGRTAARAIAGLGAMVVLGLVVLTLRGSRRAAPRVRGGTTAPPPGP